MNKSFKITYEFCLSDDESVRFDFKICSSSLQISHDTVNPPSEWTRLSNKQCTNCPLSVDQIQNCPLALSLDPILQDMSKVISYENISIKVTTNQRVISQNTTAQRGLSSLMGLVIATSGCPHTSFFKPMARFHLPMAESSETLYRAASMYLLSQYHRQVEGHTPDWNMEGLQNVYKNMQVVNRHIANRLREVCEKDAMLNALILLDLFTQTVPPSIDEYMIEMKDWFSAYFDFSDLIEPK
ncbi:MAG: hypothetical protein KC646_04345 [Candidatus Cloacimonetes bacterium]|nr:hypothetical protein [Candidatus Cloacimonadota bacterium]